MSADDDPPAPVWEAGDFSVGPFPACRAGESGGICRK